MYSEKLIKEVKEVFPDTKEMHRLAENGNAMLGRWLDDNSENGISINLILAASTLEEIKDLARKAKRKVELYKMWCDEDPRKQ